MRLSSMIFFLLLSSATLTAQTSTGNNPAVLVKPPIAQSCPVQFSVDRVPGGAFIKTNGAPAPRGQGLNIKFAKPTAQIVSADIVVHGYPAKARVIPATPPVPSEVTESFHLTASTDQPLLHSTIWTNRMILANWVELKRLEYADGTTWQSSAPRQCSASPSLFLLVDSAR
jgi:hypothetical protein